MAVTKCTKEKIQHAHREEEVELCKQDYVVVPYVIPSVAENINEFIEMSIPEPEKTCKTIRFDIPVVTCKASKTK